MIERLAGRGITLEVTDEARTLLGDLGYDPVYGARPLKRVVQSSWSTASRWPADGENREGDTVVADASAASHARKADDRHGG